MPKYEYQCIKCNVRYEVERSIHAEASAPLCCGEIMNRVFNMPAIKFNASGFYSTGG